MGIVEQYLLQLKREKRQWRRATAVLTVLSILVAIGVSWNLRQTGITLANDASCGYEEHLHGEGCMERVLICGRDAQVLAQGPAEEPAEGAAEGSAEEHVHNEACYEMICACGIEEHVHTLACYSDASADLEDWELWESTLPELTGEIPEDIVLVAQSQLGCGESTLNFELSEDGETQNGITRYGQWYGNPYGAWSNMFTSFCLYYAGVPGEVLHSGAEAMRLDWEEAGLYRYVSGYEPVSGDIVFLDKNQNGVPESTAVVEKYFDFVLTVIEGDVEHAVVRTEYRIDDPAIVGYGMTNTVGNLMALAAADGELSQPVGQAVKYSSTLLNNGGTFIVYATDAEGRHYALDGNGNAVEIQIDGAGAITAEVSDSSLLYWNFEKTSNYDNRPAYYIQNAATGQYLHPNQDSGTYGTLHPSRWSTALYTNADGVRLRGARQNAYVQLNGTDFDIANTQSGGSTFYFGRAPSQLSLWLDGTNGNIMSYRGSGDTKYTVYSGVPMQLPSTWKSPTKYHYKLAGWVDIKTGEYYRPGDMITITDNTVLYADWVANTYDIGQYNSLVTDTVSTNDFVTTHVFDYSALINLLSSEASVDVSADGHTETWSHVSDGTVAYTGRETLDFSFNDHDDSGKITNLENLNAPNKYTGGTGVYPGIYTPELREVLFGTDNLFDPETGEGVMGKHYLGQGDHLFQFGTDPTSPYYGYYYYDANLNAAAYNQSDQRFYVYDYLTRASDSEENKDYSDFLPLNSVYANNNGQNVATYSYGGDNGEYNAVTHYSFESRYEDNANAKANLWFGMRVDVQFGLPDNPGGAGANKDIYGNDMHFHFTGDDDVWILIDGKVVLDLGGIHQAADGDINFSTGEIRVNGQPAGTLEGVKAGEHTLSILYLERGASMSNCAIYFNLAPRFSLTLEKEDVLTGEVLKGAQFSFYNDPSCNAESASRLWPSKEAYKENPDGNATNTFTIGEDGKLHVWGLSPSETYYIKETAPPSPAEGLPEGLQYALTDGIIRLTLDKNGLNSYSATALEEVDKNGNKVPITNGFTVHGFRIDEKNQAAYVSITNAQNWVEETTSVYVEKRWNDTEDHTYDAVTVYLNVIDPGPPGKEPVRRIREITLSEENDWKYTWTNLPKYILDPETLTESDTPVKYSVSEAYVPGYTHQIQWMKNGSFSEEVWQESAAFQNGDVYVLKTDQGCLSSQSESRDTLCFVEESVARESPLALWTATVSSGMVRLTNQAGQSLNFRNSNWNFNVTSSGSQTNLTAFSQGTGLTLASSTYYNEWYTQVIYLGGLDANGYMSAHDNQPQSALVFHPLVKRSQSTSVPLDGEGYMITNSPLTSETALKVTKEWDYPNGDASIYEKTAITVKLLANGEDTGRTESLSLKSGWEAEFKGLPYYDENGDPISYTVVEIWDNKDWIPIYGPVTEVSGKIPTYTVTVTNRYRWIDAFELPATGGGGIFLHMLCGLILVSAPLVYGLSLRRKQKRRSSA